jgi:hypothetical protein
VLLIPSSLATVFKMKSGMACSICYVTILINSQLHADVQAVSAYRALASTYQNALVCSSALPVGSDVQKPTCFSFMMGVFNA